MPNTESFYNTLEELIESKFENDSDISISDVEISERTSVDGYMYIFILHFDIKKEKNLLLENYINYSKYKRLQLKKILSFLERLNLKDFYIGVSSSSTIKVSRHYDNENVLNELVNKYKTEFESRINADKWQL